MQTHKDLEVWRKAVLLAKQIYEVTCALPSEERYGLVAQMRRAAVSIASNIAEGAARQTDKEFIHFLHTAAGSASELDTQIEICLLIQGSAIDQFEMIQKELGSVSKMIQGLIRSVRAKAW